jgi:hypothetical protein
MAELLALQAGFATALRDADATPATARWLVGDAALLERRLAIYRANMVASADKALTAACPVLRQVVGAEFFHALARAYQRAHPSASGDLGDFGAGFPDFLAAFEHTRSLPYLPDLARLEWAAHRAYGAADAVPWDPAALSAVDPDRQEQIRFTWSPGLAVVESAYPVVRIWTIHQPGHAGEFQVDWDAAERALVARDGFAVTVAAIGPGDAAFLVASLAGARLGDAAAAALQADPLFDLATLLGRAIRSQLVCGFTL